MLASDPMSDRQPMIATPAQETADALRLSNLSLGTDSESYLVAEEEPAAFFTQNQREEVRELDEAGSLSGEGSHQTTYLAEPSSSSEASPARTSPSPESGEGSAVPAPASSTRSSGSSGHDHYQDALFSPASSSSRMSPASFPLARVVDAETAQRFYDGISESARMELRAATGSAGPAKQPGPSSGDTPGPTSPWSAPRWRTSGTASATEFSTADTSEWPRDGAASSSSLSSILEAQVDPRYYLSPRAALGILSRAGRRSRELPPHLLAALESVVRQDAELWEAYLQDATVRTPSIAPTEAETTPTTT
jgi:hypothetical protein